MLVRWRKNQNQEREKTDQWTEKQKTVPGGKKSHQRVERKMERRTSKTGKPPRENDQKWERQLEERQATPTANVKAKTLIDNLLSNRKKNRKAERRHWIGFRLSRKLGNWKEDVLWLVSGSVIKSCWSLSDQQTLWNGFVSRNTTERNFLPASS